MKKSLLSGLLAIVMLLGCIVVVPSASVAAEETVGTRDEDYRALYVSDHLVRVFDAYDPQNGTVDLANGKWYSTDGKASVSLKTPSSVKLWKARTSGIGYDVQSYNAWNSYKSQVGIDLGIANLPTGDFTVEYVMTHDGIVDANGNDVGFNSTTGYGWWNNNFSGWMFGSLHFIHFMYSLTANGISLQYRAMYSQNGSYATTTYANCIEDILPFPDTELHRPHSLSMTFDHTTAAASGGSYDKAVYNWSCDLRQFFTFDNQTTSKAYNQAYKPNSEGYFRLMYDFPGTVYTIRIYDKKLSDLEQAQNYFVDLCREAGISVAGVAELPEDARSILFQSARAYSLQNPASYKKELEALIAAGDHDDSPYAALLVTDGLTLRFDAHNPLNGTVDLVNGTWTSTDGSATATMDNKTFWTVRPSGGFGFGFTSGAQWSANNAKTGLTFDINDLPTGDFTVEFAVAMDGIVDQNGNDVYHQLADGKYGWYTAAKSTWMFGAYHLMQFLPSTAPSGASLSVRGMYSTCGSYSVIAGGGSNSNYQGNQPMMLETGLHQRQSYSVTFDHTPKSGSQTYDSASYVAYHNTGEFYSFHNQNTGITAFQTYLPNSTGMFHIMYGFPGTVYEVRIYNRVLTEAERQQNYFVDLARAFALDVTGVAELSAEDRAALFAECATLAAENGEEDRERMEGMIAFYLGKPEWVSSQALQYEGISVRRDAAGLRATFSTDATLMRLLERRYTVRYGAVMAMETGAALSSSDLTVTDGGDRFIPNRGTAVTVYSELGDYGATGLFLETGGMKNVFAYTLLFENAGLTAENLTAGIVFRGFVALTDEKGNTEIFYADAAGDIFGRQDAMYGTSTSMQEAADYFVNRYSGGAAEAYRNNQSPVLREVLSRCSAEIIEYYPGMQSGTQVDYYVDPSVPSGGAGTKASPFRTLAEAYTVAKNFYANNEGAAVTVHLLDGTHRVTETLSLTEADVASPDAWFTVTGGENAVVTGNALLSPSFTKVNGKPYYKAQLGTVNGVYPEFRNLYVNGELADLAYHGYRRYAVCMKEGGSMWTTASVGHKAGCPGLTASTDYNCLLDGCNKMYMDPEMLSGLTADQVQGAECHIAVEWEFKILHIDHVDTADVDANGNIAVYFDQADFNYVFRTNLHWNNRYFWLENDLDFLDAPGEYFYDSEAGILYYYPREGESVNSLTVEYPTVEQVFRFDGIDNLTLEGFTVTGCDNLFVERGNSVTANGAAATAHAYGGGQAGSTPSGWPELAAIYGTNLTNAAFLGLTVKNVAGDGISLRGALDNIDIDSCRFYEIGASAIRLGNGNAYDRWNHLYNSRVTNNLIDGAAWYFRHNVALYVSVAKEVQVNHNTVRNCSYSGISIGWRWSSTTSNPEDGYCNLYNVEVAYNFFENFMTDMSDGGGIYTLGGNANNQDYQDRYFNRMHHNRVIVDANTGAGKGRFMPLYHDGASSNWHSYSNVVETYHGNSGLGSFYVQYALGANDVDPVTGLAALSSQQTNNVLVENNYFLWCDWTVAESINKGTPYQASSPEDYMVKVIFWNHVRNNHHVYQRYNHLVPSEEFVNEECRATMDQAGSTLDGEH